MKISLKQIRTLPRNIFLYLLLLFFCFNNAKAQSTFTTALGFDAPFNIGGPWSPSTVGYNLTDINTVNCDMVDVSASLGTPTGDGRLWAVVYGGELGTGTAALKIALWSYTVPANYNDTFINLSNVYDPDIATGVYYNTTTSSWEYYVCIVYDDNGPSGYSQVYMDLYRINPSFPRLNYTPVFTRRQLSNNNFQHNWVPHIDLCADGRGYTSGTYTPDMHNFAAVWWEVTGTGSSQVDGVSGDLANPGTSFGSPITLIPDGQMPDVACTYDPLATPFPTSTAYVISYDNTGKTYNLTEWDLSGANPPFSSVAGIIPSTPIGAYGGAHKPRIDAATLYDHNYPDAGTLWNAVDGVFRSSVTHGASTKSEQSIFHMGYGRYASKMPNPVLYDYYGNFDASPNSVNMGSWWENQWPMICGTGDLLGATSVWNLPGKDNFYTAFYSDISCPGTTHAYGDYYTYPVGNHYPGTSSPVPGDNVAEVNTNSLNTSTPSTGLGPQSAIGIATCTNSGRELVAAWIDDNTPGSITVRCKEGSVGTSWKATDVSSMTIPSGKSCVLLPNPTTDLVKIEGVYNASYYITDMTGKKIMEGKLTYGNNKVDVHSLSAGMYILNLYQNGKSENFKFTKQ